MTTSEKALVPPTNSALNVFFSLILPGLGQFFLKKEGAWPTDFSGERCPCVFNLLVSGSSKRWKNKHRRTDNELVMVAIHPVLGVECIGCPPVESP